MRWTLEHCGIKRWVFAIEMINYSGDKPTKLVYSFQFAEFNTAGELVEMKNNEIEELTNHCQKCYEEQKTAFEKRNHSKHQVSVSTLI